METGLVLTASKDQIIKMSLVLYSILQGLKLQELRKNLLELKLMLLYGNHTQTNSWHTLLTVKHPLSYSHILGVVKVHMEIHLQWLHKHDRLIQVHNVSLMTCLSPLSEETFVNTVGTTKRFNGNRFGWYYEICPTCNKTNQSPRCPFQRNCSNNNSNPITKYKVEIEVEHENKSGYFVF